MKLMVNGIETELRDNLSVSGLLKNLEIEPVRVAVEVNLNIVKKVEFQNCVLKDGDKVEIVNFVGGG